jgi:glutathione S-transferase
MKHTLHGFAASSTAWRIRNVMAIKNIPYIWNEVDILKRMETESTTF